jgi:hypothetical protein
LEIKVTRKRETFGLLVNRDYPFMAVEEYWLMVVNEGNVLFFSPLFFVKGALDSVYKFPYRQVVERAVTLDVWLMSTNYPNMDLATKVSFSVR